MSQKKQPLHRRAYTQIKNTRIPQSNINENLFAATQPMGGFNGEPPQQWQGGLTEYDAASLNFGSPFLPRGINSPDSETAGAVPVRAGQLQPLQVDTGITKASAALQAIAAKNVTIR